MTGEIARRVDSYLDERRAEDRPASFDYCFNYFQGFRERGKTRLLADEVHLQESCLQLGFYLASWGMLRGSSTLLYRSLRYYVPVVKVLADLPEAAWDLDVPGYDQESIPLLLDTKKRVQEGFAHHATDTLITKTMLGVLGCVPAFDTDFGRGFNAYRCSPKALRRLRAVYNEHATEIEAARPCTLDFTTGQETDRRYPVAKVMDMVFIQGRL